MSVTHVYTILLFNSTILFVYFLLLFFRKFYIREKIECGTVSESDFTKQSLYAACLQFHKEHIWAQEYSCKLLENLIDENNIKWVFQFMGSYFLLDFWHSFKPGSQWEYVICVLLFLLLEKTMKNFWCNKMYLLWMDTFVHIYSILSR